MRHCVSTIGLFGCLALPACQAPPTTVADQLADWPVGVLDHPPRLRLRGNRVVASAVAIAAAAVPPVVRATFDAVAPDGETLFVGREWGPRGHGFRLEKRYTEPVEHERSVLVGNDGAVLERSHSLPLPRVPDHVLAKALESGPFVDEAHIVSGPAREEHWLLLVHDRHGEVFVVVVDLAGNQLDRWRRTTARLDT